MTRHTLGPWSYSDGSVYGANGETIAVDIDAFQNADANGALLAAAPALLAALVDLTNTLSAHDEDGLTEQAEVMIAARAAIANALLTA